MQKDKKSDKFDLILILIYPIFASLISLFLRVNLLSSVFIFYGVPAIYLSIKAKKYITKTLIFSIIIVIPLTIILDSIAHLTETWFVPSIFNFRFLGLVSAEVFIWALFYVYFVVMFYEYFLDKHVTKKRYNKNLRYFTIILLIFLALFFFTWIANPSYLKIPYFYLVFGIILFLMPILIILFNYPLLVPKIFKTAAYIFFHSFAYEITALKLRLWDFPGSEFIGWVNIFGVSFPFEELFFWMILGAFAVLVHYEFFDDDRK